MAECNVRVICRFRPISEGEKANEKSVQTPYSLEYSTQNEKRSIVVHHSNKNTETQVFSFDRTFWDTSSTQVFSAFEFLISRKKFSKQQQKTLLGNDTALHSLIVLEMYSMVTTLQSSLTVRSNQCHSYVEGKLALERAGLCLDQV